MISRRGLITISAAALVGVSVAGTIAISEARPKKIVRKGEHTGIFQHALKHHKHAKHVMHDTKSGDVVWTLHNGTTVTFTKFRPAGTFNGPRPANFTQSDHYTLSKLSLKIPVWCAHRGTVFPGGVEP